MTTYTGNTSSLFLQNGDVIAPGAIVGVLYGLYVVQIDNDAVVRIAGTVWGAAPVLAYSGATLTVASSSAAEIVAKGARPDLAEEAHLLLSRLAPRTLEEPEPRPSASRRVDEKDLVRKLTDLHRAGVLTTMEFEEKKELVARLARAEQFTQLSR